jgi:hypothetical protein
LDNLLAADHELESAVLWHVAKDVTMRYSHFVGEESSSGEGNL